MKHRVTISFEYEDGEDHALTQESLEEKISHDILVLDRAIDKDAGVWWELIETESLD